MTITTKQQAILDFIREQVEMSGVPPSQIEIAAAFGFQRNSTALYHLRALEAAGMLARVHLPVLGRVAAGAPIGADIGIDEKLLLDRNCFAPTPDYLLRVQGDSMRDDGIFDGDLVAVKRTPEALSGQIVVARIDGEITIKRLKLAKREILLLPRNPDYPPIHVPADADFAIEGIYCGLVRRG